MKTCRICKIQKDSSQFYNGDTKTGRLASYCKECEKIRNRNWHLRNPEKAKLKNRRKNWKRRGITITDTIYQDLLKEQQGRCKACLRLETELWTALSVDHDHTTGKIRGLLCGRCNWVLGLVEDNEKLLCALSKYLKIKS